MYFRAIRLFMIIISDAKLEALATHYAGNKAAGEPLQFSKELVDTESQEVKSVLLSYFLTSFQQAESYNFWHPSDIALNEIKHYADQIFEAPEDILQHSISIVRNLYDATDLPNIKSGELHVAYFKGIMVDQFVVDAIGIYKSENKDTFLTILRRTNRSTGEPLKKKCCRFRRSSNLSGSMSNNMQMSGS